MLAFDLKIITPSLLSNQLSKDRGDSRPSPCHSGSLLFCIRKIMESQSVQRGTPDLREPWVNTAGLQICGEDEVWQRLSSCLHQCPKSYTSALRKMLQFCFKFLRRLVSKKDKQP